MSGLSRMFPRAGGIQAHHAPAGLEHAVLLRPAPAAGRRRCAAGSPKPPRRRSRSGKGRLSASAADQAWGLPERLRPTCIISRVKSAATTRQPGAAVAAPRAPGRRCRRPGRAGGSPGCERARRMTSRRQRTSMPAGHQAVHQVVVRGDARRTCLRTARARSPGGSVELMSGSAPTPGWSSRRRVRR